MRFSTILAATAFGAFAAASETVQVKDLTVRETSGQIQLASFKLQPANVECSSSVAADLAGGKVVTCGTTKYRFGIKRSTPEVVDATKGITAQYDLTLYKETGLAAGITGTLKVGAYCAAANSGPNDKVCTPVGEVTGVIY